MKKKSNINNILNICDIYGNLMGSAEIFCENCIESLDFEIKRIYIGSYYCDHYFIQHKNEEIIIKYARDKGYKVSIVVPPVFQNNIKSVLNKIEIILKNNNDVIDEIVINDIGLIKIRKIYPEIRIIYGRLLEKDNRDPRYKDFFEQPHVFRIFSGYYDEFFKAYEIDAVELDCTHKTMQLPDKCNGIEMRVHKPFCYISLGSICKYASLHSDKNNRLHFAGRCICECDTNLIRYNLEELELYRIGRSVQFDNGECVIEGNSDYATVYFPFKELVRIKEDEYFSTLKSY